MKLSSAILMLFLIVTIARPGDIPTKRFALVIGSNTGYQGRVQLKYAVRDARTVAGVLSSLGGVESNDIVLINDPTLDQLSSGLDRFADMVTHNGPGRKEVVLYYSGHADERGILLGKDLLTYGKIKTYVDQLPADVRIIVLDACSSGELTREKGGTMRPAFLFDASAAMNGHAYLTSSSENEGAQESDSLKGSIFTHYLVSGLRGGADANSDGKITLDEAYQYAYHETLRRTENTYYGAQHPAYDIRLKGSGNLVMTDLRSCSAKLRLDPQMAGRIYVRDESGVLLVELNKTGGKNMEVGLEPGIYHVTLESANDGLYRSDIRLTDKSFAEVKKIDMQKIKGEMLTLRGDTDHGSVTADEDYRVVPISLSFVPFDYKPSKTITIFSLGMIGSYTTRLHGVDISGVFSVSGEEVRGVQISGVSNVINGSLQGVGIGGVTNIVRQKSTGIQIGGVMSHSEELNGAQIGGVINTVLRKSSGIQIAGVFNHTQEINGIQIGGVVNNVNGKCAGLQIGGVGNKTAIMTAGVQIAGVANVNVKSADSSKGAPSLQQNNLLQIAGVINRTGPVNGIQISGVANSAGTNSSGVQIAGVANLVSKFHGLQIGTVNFADSMSGVQIGVINISRNNTGVPIGLLSIVKNNPPRAQVWTDESGYLLTGIRSGTPNVYTILSAGGRMSMSVPGWALGLGIGFRVPVYIRTFIALEALTMRLNENTSWDIDELWLMKWRLVGGFRLASHFSIFCGPSINSIWTDVKTQKRLSYWAPELVKRNYCWTALWPGFAAGVEF
jgi:hypothetical protein